MSETDSQGSAPARFSIYTVANLFAVAGFFLHPLLHWWVRSNPSMELAMHGYTSLWLEADRVIALRFLLVWMAEIATLWLLGAAIAILARSIMNRRSP